MLILSQTKLHNFRESSNTFDLVIFFDDQTNNPIPKSKSEIPIQENIFKYSPTTKTPNNAAVSGSASESVTAVDEETPERPLAKRKYANPVATIPK